MVTNPNIKLFIIFLTISFSLFAANSYVELASERGNETLLHFSMSESDYAITTVEADGKKLDLIYLSHGAYDEPKSVPHLPQIAQSMIIPNRPKMKLEIVNAQFTEISVNTIAPSKGSLSRKIDPETVPYEFGEMYTQNGWYPAQCAKLGTPYIARHFRANVVYFQPFQFNPSTNTLKIYSQITVKVSATDEPGINIKTKVSSLKIGPDFQQIYSRRFINFANKRYDPVDEEGTMLIISHGDFMATMEPFVAWKKKRGVKIEMVDVADVGSNSSSITSYAADYYNNKDLKYLLLVGDNQQVPTSSSGGDPSDNKYGCIEGSDSYVEVFVGRFSGTEVAHIQTQVNKVLHYERKLGDSDTWLNKGYGTYSSNEQDDKDAIAHIKTDLEAFTYTSVATGGSEQRNLISSIQDGIGCHINSSHGNKTSIAGIRTTNVPSLTNDGMYPFNFTLACNPGEFDGSGDCLGEAVVKKEGGGYIGAFMASISQPWNEPYAGIHEHTDILTEQYTDNIKRTYGGIAHNGCMKMIDDYSSKGPWVSDCWILFGDPSLLVYTDAPKPITINHPTEVANGSQDITITGTEDATVCLYNAAMGIQEVAKLTGGTATITVEIQANEKDSLAVTAYAFNFQTYEGSISINTGPYIAISAPAPGEEVWAGDKVTIKWQTGGGAVVDKVKLEFSADNGGSFTTIVAETENDGSHDWTVPDVNESDQCVIKVTDVNGTVEDISGLFTIKQKAIIAVGPAEIKTACKPDQAMEKPVTIDNKGKGKLTFSVAITGGGAIMVNELYMGNSEPADGFELWNRGSGQDMTGWKLIFNDDAQSSGEYEFESGYIFKSNTLIVCDDIQGSDFYLGDLKWAETTELSISLLDASGKGVDFVRTAGNSDQPPVGTTWDGDGVDIGQTYVYRNRNEDTDSKADWSMGASGTIGSLNPGQSISIRADHWLRVTPTEGTVNALSNIALKVTLDATGLEEKTYTDTIVITHDAPDQATPITIPVTLKVDANTAIVNGNTEDPDPNLLSIGPDPAVTDVHFTLNTTRGLDGAALSIYDALGNLVHTTGNLLLLDGNASWDLTNLNGKPVGNGAYLVVVELSYSDGSVKQLRKLLGVKEE